MPPRKKVTLPDHVRAAVLADIVLSHQTTITAEENEKVRIFLATEQGLDTYEIAEHLGMSQSGVSNYRRQGKEIWERRELEKRSRGARGNPIGEDPLRSGELTPLR